MIQIKDSADVNYKLIIGSLMKYEDQNVDYYSESDMNKRVLTNPGTGDIKERVDDTYR